MLIIIRTRFTLLILNTNKLITNIIIGDKFVFFAFLSLLERNNTLKNENIKQQNNN